MKCPECYSNQVHTVDSRMRKSGMERRRRRECINGHRFSTVEIHEGYLESMESAVGVLVSLKRLGKEAENLMIDLGYEDD